MNDAQKLFKEEIFYALLHADCNPIIIEKVIDQFQTKGPSYVLCKVSREAKKFRDWARQVKFERHRAVAFIRLRPIEQKHALFGEFEVKHKTHDLIMLHFMERFPNYTIIISFGDFALIGKDKQIYKGEIDEGIKASRFQGIEVKDEFEKLWLAFYKSQYIPERRNLTYLKRMLPKKYWKWTPELTELMG